MVKRSDMTFLDTVGFKVDQKYYKADLLEAAAFLLEPDFQTLTTASYRSVYRKKAEESMKKRNLEVSGFYCMGRALNEVDFFD